MATDSTRREFLGRVTAAAAGAAIGGLVTPGCAKEPAASNRGANPSPRVAIARDEALTRGAVQEHADLLRKLLDAAVQKVTGSTDASSAWRKLFKPGDRVGI